MSSPLPRPGVLDVAAYVGGESSLPDVNRVIKLASNEGALGPSPKALAASQGKAQDVCRYPDGASLALRQAIGKRFGLNPARIVCGAGSDELLAILCRGYAGTGDEVLYSQYGFLMYAITATGLGAKPVAAPEANLTADVDALLAHVSEKTRIVFLANPNNPTGTYLPFDEIRRLHKGLPDRIVLVIDAAYAEYMTADDYRPGIELVDEAENVAMTRTFSKIFALGGLRLGWCYGPPAIIDVINRLRGPFNVTTTAHAAGIAALEDDGFVQRVREHTLRWRQWTRDRLLALGLDVPESVTNFLLVRFGEAARADAADEYLRSRGLIIRRMGSYGLPDSHRVTIGTEEEMRLYIDAMAAFVRMRQT
jgi:histidinol-phosphate aminotransferase